jgi:hypothetical protein
MKDKPIRVCAKTAFVGWPTESRRMSSFHNFLSFSHYFIKYIKLVYRKQCGYGIMFLLFTCMHNWLWGILRRWSACAPTACELVSDWRKSEKHWAIRVHWEDLSCYWSPFSIILLYSPFVDRSSCSDGCGNPCVTKHALTLHFACKVRHRY